MAAAWGAAAARPAQPRDEQAASRTTGKRARRPRYPGRENIGAGRSGPFLLRPFAVGSQGRTASIWQPGPERQDLDWRDQRRPRSSSQLGEGMGPGSRPSPWRCRWGVLASWHWPGRTALARRTDPRRGVGRSRAGGRRGGWLEKDMVEHSRIWISHLGVSAPWGARPLSWTWWVPSRKRRRRNSVLVPALRAQITVLASFCRNFYLTHTSTHQREAPPQPCNSQ